MPPRQRVLAAATLAALHAVLAASQGLRPRRLPMGGPLPLYPLPSRAAAVFDNTDALALGADCNLGGASLSDWTAINFRFIDSSSACGLGLFALQTLTLGLRTQDATTTVPVAFNITLLQDTEGAASTTPARVVATTTTDVVIDGSSAYYDLPLPGAFAADASAGLSFAIAFSANASVIWCANPNAGASVGRRARAAAALDCPPAPRAAYPAPADGMATANGVLTSPDGSIGSWSEPTGN